MSIEIEKTLFWTKKVLTKKEVAKYTGLAEGTIQNMAHARVIPHSKPTSRITFFEREKLEQWMLSNPVQTKAEGIQAAIEHVAKNPISSLGKRKK